MEVVEVGLPTTPHANACYQVVSTAEADGMRSIEEWLLTDHGVDVGDWVLRKATGISADGTTIVGWGRNPAGDHDGWIIRIPEPASALGLLLAGGLLLRRRRG